MPFCPRMICSGSKGCLRNSSVARGRESYLPRSEVSTSELMLKFIYAKGSLFIATDTPEEVAADDHSYTGLFLKPLLKRWSLADKGAAEHSLLIQAGDSSSNLC